MIEQIGGDRRAVRTVETGLDALRRSPDFRGPVEPLDNHEHVNDHLALIYESREEQFAAAIPFLRQGLELGERCVYITEENPREVVVEEMETRGIDVDAAIESGQLSIHDEHETYLRTGRFDPDDTIAFLDETIAAANEEFDGLRVTGEMGWVLGEDPDVEDLIKCEGKANYLFDEVDGMALCQYNRERFPADVIRDVISTHPHLIHGDRVSHNSYYTPPTEFFGPERPEQEVDRLLGTLREQTEAKVALEERERHLHRHHEITADPDRTFEQKVNALFGLGCERFDLELGAMARVDVDADRVEIEYVSGDHDYLEPGVVLPLSDTYCAATTDGGVTSVTDPTGDDYEAIAVRTEFGFDTYLGTLVEIEDGPDRTFFFMDSDPRDRAFSRDERTFHRLMGQWVKYELERHYRERTLERTVDRLEASNERLEQFAYAASHDLQEPLRMVSSYLRLIERRAPGELSAETEEFLEFAVDGADRMREMVDGLLEYSRIETRGRPFESIDLETVFEDVLDDLQLRIDESDAEITATSLPRVEGDGDQLRQVFQNLLDNAITYSGDEPPRIRVDAERECDEWTISVRDEGIGIDADDPGRVFDVFDRLHTREEYAGTGIGLAICERIIERHGGEIRVESEPGEGATFLFTLPAADSGY
ncbi:MEDS domain-containing protein [Halosolutus gelatinilyticus]|uniref:MEDS domain-containing protein n=1 Tax=Halosolutus gelatinilyticus TaxID=2931975 RepID=UPI001FF1109A|nr:MEDS domain-containing protein [Halosolutus gelatinilyticus]